GTTNLLSANQSSVETDTTGFDTANFATIARDTSKAWHGSASLRIVRGSGDPAVFMGSTTAFDVAPGEFVTWSCMLEQGDGLPDARLRIRWADASGVAVGFSDSPAFTPSGFNGKRHSFTAQAP